MSWCELYWLLRVVYSLLSFDMLSHGNSYSWNLARIIYILFPRERAVWEVKKGEISKTAKGTGVAEE